VAAYLDMIRHIGAGPFGVEDEVLRAYAEVAWDRGDGRTAGVGVARQINAIMKSGDRTAELGRIVAPTLVVHGDRDLMVHPSGGHATADAIPGARLVVIRGMRHHFARSLIPRLVDLTVEHIRRHAPASEAREAVEAAG
jgi:pimeloyl-ACP methyl ester carboxylesterase